MLMRKLLLLKLLEVHICQAKKGKTGSANNLNSQEDLISIMLKKYRMQQDERYSEKLPQQRVDVVRATSNPKLKFFWIWKIIKRCPGLLYQQLCSLTGIDVRFSFIFLITLVNWSLKSSQKEKKSRIFNFWSFAGRFRLCWRNLRIGSEIRNK